jgi:hypothetical protein
MYMSQTLRFKKHVYYDGRIDREIGSYPYYPFSKLVTTRTALLLWYVYPLLQNINVDLLRLQYLFIELSEELEEP